METRKKIGDTQTTQDVIKWITSDFEEKGNNPIRAEWRDIVIALGLVREHNPDELMTDEEYATSCMIEWNGCYEYNRDSKVLRYVG